MHSYRPLHHYSLFLSIKIQISSLMASLHAHATPPLIRQPMASGSCTDVAAGGSQREVCGTQERLRIFLNFLLTPFFFFYLSNHFCGLKGIGQE